MQSLNCCPIKHLPGHKGHTLCTVCYSRRNQRIRQARVPTWLTSTLLQCRSNVDKRWLQSRAFRHYLTVLRVILLLADPVTTF